MGDTVHRAEDRQAAGLCLKKMCFQAVRTHFSAVGAQAVLDLPVPLIKDLLPHLTVCQLDELQPPLNQRDSASLFSCETPAVVFWTKKLNPTFSQHEGISTHSEWVGVMKDIFGPNHAKDVETEEGAKVEVMRAIFNLVFYGLGNAFVEKNITSLNAPSYLWAAAKCNRHFLLVASSYEALQGLTAEQRPILDLQEKQIRNIYVWPCIDLSKKTTQTALYILHRLLDHGVAKELIVKSDCPIVLAWLLHGRGSQYINPELKNLMHRRAAPAGEGGACCSPGLETRTSEDQDHQAPQCKRSKLDSVSAEEGSGKINCIVDPQVLCLTFTPCDSPSVGTCPRGQIESLNLSNCGSDCLMELISALPTFYCLRSLTLNSPYIFRYSDVFAFALALRQLSASSRSSLTNLSMSVLPHTQLMPILLDASPNVTSLHVEIESLISGLRIADMSQDETQVSFGKTAELSLEKLTVKVTEDQTDLNFITSVLRRSPHLTTLHVAGLRLSTGSSQSQLLSTLSGSNHLLRSLSLEDMNLSDCLSEILHLLRGCKLEELRLNDCRLLEKWNNKEEGLQRLVAALKAVPSLHTLSLAQNRLAKNVCVLAELFSGCSPSSVKRLDISSNFIQPAELLEFTKRLRTHRPPHQLSLDLRRNPGDRDPDTWNAAMQMLRPFCVLQVKEWTSTNMMADHISNM